MRAEIAKLRYLPLPRWMGAVSLAVAVLAGVLLILFKPGNADTYILVPTLLLEFGLAIVAIVLGTWFATLDYASGTWQRTLTAESSRNRVLASKLTIALAATALLAVAVALTGAGLAEVATTRADVTLDANDLVMSLVGQLPAILGAVVVGFGFGLLSRSFGGGVTLGLGFIFVLSSFLVLVPSLADWSYPSLTGNLAARISGSDGVTGPAAFAAVLGTIGWLLLILVPAWVRFLRSDVK